MQLGLAGDTVSVEPSPYMFDVDLSISEMRVWRGAPKQIGDMSQTSTYQLIHSVIGKGVGVVLVLC
jgi:hypothetical protein